MHCWFPIRYTRSEETSIVENPVQDSTRGEKEKLGNISLNEALGRRDSELLSSIVGEVITITSVEMENGKDKDGKDFQRAYINTEDKTYRSSNKAILPKAESISKKLGAGQTLTVRIVEKKVKKGVGKFIDFEEVKE